jgi:hypothetical protein
MLAKGVAPNRVPAGSRQATASAADGSPRIEALAPNGVWPMDYTGRLRVGDGMRCEPLTINNMHSRASLISQAMVQPKSHDARRRRGKRSVPSDCRSTC